jgi:fumarate reductase subunit D
MTRELHRSGHHPFGASAPTSLTGLLRPIAVGLGMAIAFVTIFLSALHDPEPHELPIAVVGAAADSSQAAQAFDQASPGSFDVRSYDTAGAAEAALQSRDVYGVMDLTARRTVHISYAGANGSGVTSAVERALTATAAQLGRPSTTTDAVPLPSGDSRGLSVFYFVFGLALSAFLFAMTFHQVAAGASLAVRIGVPLLFAGATGLVLATIADLGFEALTGHFWAVAGISAMISYAVSTATSALTRLLGGAGIGLAGLLAIVIGNATSGGALNWHFLPAGWRWLSQHLPTGAGVTGLLNVQYFDAADLSPVLLTLSAWIAASLLLIVSLPLLRLDAVHRSHHGRHERGDSTSEAI